MGSKRMCHRVNVLLGNDGGKAESKPIDALPVRVPSCPPGKRDATAAQQLGLHNDAR